MARKTNPIFEKGELTYKEVKRLLFFGIPWPFTHYLIYTNDIVIQNGLLNLKEDDCYMYKITDVRISRSLWQRICSLSTVTCYTSDVTTQTIEMINIHNGPEIKDFILSASEEARLKRRTVSMQNISFDADSLDDFDPDD